MARPLPAHPRTRIEEILRARGLTQRQLIELTGWSPAHANRLVIGRKALTLHSATTLARVLEVPRAALFGEQGEPIPPRPGLEASPEGVAERLGALAVALGAPWDGLLRYVLAGDYSALPPLVADRLRDALFSRGPAPPNA